MFHERDIFFRAHDQLGREIDARDLCAHPRRSQSNNSRSARDIEQPRARRQPGEAKKSRCAATRVDLDLREVCPELSLRLLELRDGIHGVLCSLLSFSLSFLLSLSLLEGSASRKAAFFAMEAARVIS